MLTKILVVFCVVLLTALVFTYRQNKTFRSDNSRLILLNDSIMSENIELKKMIEPVDTAGKKTISNTKNKK